VLLAMGFLGPEQPLLDALQIERDPRTNVKADFEKSQPTSRASSPAATAVAARAWWYGHSTRPRHRRECGSLFDGPHGLAVKAASRAEDQKKRPPDDGPLEKSRVLY